MQKIIKLFLIITFFSIGTTNTATTRLRVLATKLRFLSSSIDKLAALKEFNIGTEQEINLLRIKHPNLITSMVQIGLQQAMRRDSHARSYQLHEPLKTIYDTIGYPEENQHMTFANIYIFYVTTFKATLTEESFNDLIQPIVDNQRLSIFEKIIALKEITTIGALKTGVGFATLFLVGLAITNQF